MPNIRHEINSVGKQKIRGDQSPEEMVARVQRMTNPVTGVIENPPFESPLESDNDWMTRVQYSISADPRTRKQGEPLEDASLRRNQAFTQNLKTQEAKRADSTDSYEKKIAHELNTMGILEGYRTYIPDWAVRDED